MVFGIVYQLTCHVVGVLYPGYLSYKAIRSRDWKEYQYCLYYWVLYSCVSSFDFFLDGIMNYLPFYSWFKVGFLLWLVMPQTRGAKYLYKTYIHRYLRDHEEAIDGVIEDSVGRVRNHSANVTASIIEASRRVVIDAVAQGVLQMAMAGNGNDNSNGGANVAVVGTAATTTVAPIIEEVKDVNLEEQQAYDSDNSEEGASNSVTAYNDDRSSTVSSESDFVSVRQRDGPRVRRRVNSSSSTNDNNIGTLTRIQRERMALQLRMEELDDAEEEAEQRHEAAALERDAVAGVAPSSPMMSYLRSLVFTPTAPGLNMSSSSTVLMSGVTTRRGSRPR